MGLSCEERIIKSRIYLLINQPFFGVLALNLTPKIETNIETAATDGTNFYYNPEFIDKLSDAELNWLTSHEVMHAALGHIWRQGSRQPQKFNIAADYAIHSLLYENTSSEFQMPKGGLYNKDFDNQATEEIYDLLPDPPKMTLKHSGSGNSGDGNGDGQSDNSQGGSTNQTDDIDMQKVYGGNTIDDHSLWNKEKNKSNSEQQAEAKKWEQKMISAVEVAEAKQKGSVPGSILRIVGQLKKPQKNWKQLLADFVQTEPFDYGFCPPDKRMYGLGDILLPAFSEETEKIQDIVFVIDTSGSIGDAELIAFFSELVGMMEQFNSSVNGHIIFADSNIAAVYDFEDVDDILKARPAGGGGTDFIPAFKYCNNKIDTNEWDVSGLVYLTDGYGNFPNENDVHFPTLWLSTTKDMSYPFGQVAYLDLKC